MRYVLILWALPVGLLGAWYFLSYNDINFGTIFLSRALHDAVFQLYGDMLGIAPETVPWLVLEALAFDTVLSLALFAFRRRRQIRAWWTARRMRDEEGRRPPALPERHETPQGLYSPAE